LLCSDFVLLREGLCALLANYPNIEVIGQSAGTKETLARTQELAPGVVLLHVSQDDEEAFKTIEHLRSGPAPPIIAVAASQDHHLIMRLLRAGVRGYLSDREAEAELVLAVEAVARGEVFLCPSAGQALLTRYRKQSQSH
jgi:DNA-binding NarL/FixJ family response regulator